MPLPLKRIVGSATWRRAYSCQRQASPRSPRARTIPQAPEHLPPIQGRTKGGKPTPASFGRHRRPIPSSTGFGPISGKSRCPDGSVFMPASIERVRTWRTQYSAFATSAVANSPVTLEMKRIFGAAYFIPSAIRLKSSAWVPWWGMKGLGNVNRLVLTPLTPCWFSMPQRPRVS